MGKCFDCDRDAYSRGYCRLHYQRHMKSGLIRRLNTQRVLHCTNPGCLEPVFAKNLCSIHYKRAEHPMKNLWRMLRSRDKGQYPASWDRFEVFIKEVGEKPGDKYQLRRIDTRLPWSGTNFKWLEPMQSKYRDYYTKEMRADYQRDWHLRTKFGITLDQYNAMLEAQGGVCATCKSDEVFINPKTGEPQDLCVDHDHETGVVRGLLCVGCNRGIGYFRDSPEKLKAAADYLERHTNSRLVCDDAVNA